MYYLVQPLIGLVLGGLTYLIVGSVFLLLNTMMPNSSGFDEILSSSTIIAVQVTVSWMVGFRQRFILEMLKKIGTNETKNDEDVDEAEDSSHQSMNVASFVVGEKIIISDSSYSWSFFIFFYAVVWLIVFFIGILFSNQISSTLSNESMIRFAWLTALAGGLGGVIRIMYSLAWHVSIKQDFNKQFTMYYLTQPIMGFILGALVYFIVSSSLLVINSVFPDLFNVDIISSPVNFVFQVVLAWFAGFRQRYVLEIIEKTIQRFSSKKVDG